MNTQVEDFLAHYGVKGQRWGVVNEEDSKLKTEFKTFSDKQKYGSMTKPEEKIEDQGFFKSLTPAQKKAALIFGGTVIVAGLAYGAHHYNVKQRDLIDPQTLLSGGNPLDGLRASHAEGMLAYRNNGVNLPAGSLVARVSKDVEKNIRPGGFYAAHETHDVESYKAFLGAVGGHTNYFKANEAVKAPSTTEYIRMLGKAMDTPEVLKHRNIDIKALNRLSPDAREKVLFRLATDELGKKDFAFSLNASTVEGFLPQRFVKEVLGSGYTSVIDYNNASGSTAQAPLRHLNGKMFSFFSSEPLTGEVKQLAMLNQEANMEKIGAFYDNLVHSVIRFINTLLLQGVPMKPNADEFLEHFGVKGQKWGVRNNTTAANQTKARANGLGQKQLKNESARVAAAGGGLRGTLKVRKEMIDSGELSKEQAQKGVEQFGRNVALGLLSGVSIGIALGPILAKTLR